MTLYGLQNLDPSYTTCLLLEGESDALRAWQDVHQAGLPVNVLGLPQAGFRKEFLRELENIQNIIFIPQSDLPGGNTIKDARELLGDNFSFIELPWKSGQFGNDYCDWRVYNEFSFIKKEVEQITGDVNNKVFLGADFDEIKEVEDVYLISNLIMQGNVFFIAGPQKSKKTWFALELIRTILCQNESLCGMNRFIGTRNDASVLLIEQEGPRKKLKERIDYVLKDTDWKKRLHIGHKLNMKLDNPEDVKRLIKLCVNIDCLIIDPFQKMHSQNEDSATEMAKVWDAINKINHTYPNMTIGIIHHFNKSASVTDTWKAMRGSSRNAGEADLGFFMEKRAATDIDGAKLVIDGRDYEHNEREEIIKLEFTSSRRLIVTEEAVKAHKDTLVDYFEEFELKSVSIKDLSKLFAVNQKTIKNWIKDDPRFEISEEVGRGNLKKVFYTSMKEKKKEKDK